MHKFFKNVFAILMAAIFIFSVPIGVRADSPLSPIREFFERAHAQVNWNGSLRQITINLNDNEIRLYIDRETAYINNLSIDLNSVVTIENGISFMLLEDAQAILDALPGSVSPIPGGYGTIAYRHLNFIEENLPYRFPFTQRERETAEWIAQELADMGHSSENIRIQTFPTNDNMSIDISLLREPLDEIPATMQGALESLLVFDFDDLAELEFVDYSQNVILTVPGVSEKRIIVGAHYDSPNNVGISDNASGVVVLLESAERILDFDNYYTITYIFFGAEEVGLVGSLYYLNSLTEADKENIVLMINIDVIFDGTVLTYAVGYHNFDTNNEGSNDVTRAIEGIANDLNEEFNLGLLRQPRGVYVTSDQLSFLFAGLDILVFYSVGDFIPSSTIAKAVVTGDFPELTPSRIALMIAMLDGIDEPNIILEIERDRDALELFLRGYAEIPLEFALEQFTMLEQLIETSDDDDFIAEVSLSLEMLEMLITILEHPGLEEFSEQYDSIGLVLHTANDNIAYLHENFPGLIQRALEAYSIFLERTLTLPAGSLS